MGRLLPRETIVARADRFPAHESSAPESPHGGPLPCHFLPERDDLLRSIHREGPRGTTLPKAPYRRISHHWTRGKPGTETAWAAASQIQHLLEICALIYEPLYP